MERSAESTRGDSELMRIQELFHGLIRSRARQGGLDIPGDLPPLDRRMTNESEPRWYPVQGMAGGFAFRLQYRERWLELTAESWCRVVGGSGQRHLVTAQEVILKNEGFV